MTWEMATNPNSKVMDTIVGTNKANNTKSNQLINAHLSGLESIYQLVWQEGPELLY